MTLDSNRREAGSGRSGGSEGAVGWRWGEQGELDQGAKERRQPAQQQAEVVAGGEDGIGAVAFESFQVVAVHTVLALQVARSPARWRRAPHLPADAGVDLADLSGDPDAEAVGIIVTARLQ